MSMHQHHIASLPENIVWGHLPHRDSKPVLRIASGDTVVFDTISHEGLVEDQGRDPVAFFSRYGVPRNKILDEVIAIAASELSHSFDNDGPHTLIGPVHIEGAQPGDVLKIEVLTLEPRVLYGIIANRHHKGSLPGEFPEHTVRQPDANPGEPEKYGSTFVFASIEKTGLSWRGKITAGEWELTFPLTLFLGTMGVTPDADEAWNSIPPTRVGGNIDINELGAGATLYLPVEVAGALFYTGDPHFAQGDGEVSLTALEGSLRATLRLTVLSKNSADIPSVYGDTADALFAETETHWIVAGLHSDLNEAVKTAVRAAVGFLSRQFGIDRRTVYAYLSAAADFELSQVVDRNKGVHALIRKADFHQFTTTRLAAGECDLPLTNIDDVWYVSASAVCVALHLPYEKTAEGTIAVSTSAGLAVMKPDSNTYRLGSDAIRLCAAPVMGEAGLLLPVSAVHTLLGAPITWSTVGRSIHGRVTLPDTAH